MKNLLLLASVVVLAASCATEPTSDTAGADGGSAPKPLVFADLPVFDRTFAQSLSSANGPVVVTSADFITLKQMPQRLEKWLAAVDDGGGKIETQALDNTEPATRSIGLIFTLIGAIRQVREMARDAQYATARNFNATIFYRLDAKGDRVVDRIEMVRKIPAGQGSSKPASPSSY